MDPLDLARHAFALRASGYTRLPAVATGRWLDELTSLTDRSLAEAERVFKLKGTLTHCNLGHDYTAARATYCWGEAGLRLIECDEVHDLASATMDQPRLWDLSPLTLLPTSNIGPSPAASWHRDMPVQDTASTRPRHLWFFLCIDATTTENGATWIVPGSHHALAGNLAPDARAGGNPYPSAIQLCGQAGDILVLDPTALHASGTNRTRRPRRLLNVAVCGSDAPPLLNHWAIAGPAIRSQASPRLRAMLETPGCDRDRTWDALPPGWVTEDC